jgi:hypothetical protein
MRNALPSGIGLLAACFFFLFSPQTARATHAMGAEITYECVSGNTYLVTLAFYRDCEGIVPNNSKVLTVYSPSCNFSTSLVVNKLANYPIDVSPLCPAQKSNSECQNGTLPGVEQFLYQGTISLPFQCADWTFGFKENFRNASITTIDKPGSTYLYVESTLNNLDVSCNDSPTFSNIPTPFICIGQSYTYNHGAIDAQGDSLVYSLVPALHDQGIQVTYRASYSGTNPFTSSPSMAIDPANGNVTMTPTALAVGVMAVRVSEYRNGVLIGSVTRDIQVTVLNCNNNSPVLGSVTNLAGGVLLGSQQIEVCANTPVSFTIPGTDPDNTQSLSMTWNSGINGASFSATSGTSPVSGSFSWTPGSADAGVHSFVLNLEDNGCPLFGQTAKAISIKVVDGVTAGPDQAICGQGGGVQLNALGGTSHSWRVISGDPSSLSCTNCTSPLATPGQTSRYEVTSNLPCNNIDTVQVNVTPGFTMSLTADTGVCEGAMVPLAVNASPASNYTYQWSPATGLNATNTASVNASPQTSTRYTVDVYDPVTGCRIIDSVDVNVSQNALVAVPSSSASQYCAGQPVDLFANVAGASCSGYSVQSITHNPVSGSGTSLALGDESVSNAIPIGFNFDFYCSTYSNVYISSNGWLTFSSTMASDPQYITGLIPSSSDPDALIAFAWDDLDPGAGGSIEYFTTGTAPNRKFVLNFTNVPHYGCSSCLVSTQLVLEETTHAIEIHNTRVDNHTTSGTMTQGIENGTGTVGLTVSGRNASTWSATNDAYRFTLAATPGTYTVSWQSPLGTPVGTGDNLTVTPSQNTTYYAVVSDLSGSCVTTTPLAVDVAYVDAGPDHTINYGDSALLNGTYVGPPPTVDCDAYTRSSIPYSWVSGSGINLNLGANDISSSISLGFDFEYYCNTFNSVRIAEDGFISFSATAGDNTNDPLPRTFAPNGLIAVVWENLKQRTNNNYNPRISYQRLGTAPNRRFVVKFEDLVFYRTLGGNDRIYAQVVLYEGSNLIEIHNQRVDGSGDQATQGIESPNGQAGMAVAGRNAQSWSVSSSFPDAWRFTPPSTSIQYSWSNAGYLNSHSLEDPKASPPFDTWFVLTVDNGECILRDSAQVFIQPLPIHLLAFEGERVGEESHLFWKVQESMESEFFIIERAEAGTDFVELEHIPAIGTSSEIRTYEYIDSKPYSGFNLYRLKMLGAGGEVSFSPQVEIYFPPAEKNRLLAVYPNPSSQVFFFEGEAKGPGKLQIEVYGMDGRKVQLMQQEVNQRGTFRESLDMGRFPPGLYTYRLTLHEDRFDGKISLIK